MYIRKILFGLVFILLCANISYSQSGWVYQNPTPGIGTRTYFSSFFINDNTGWVGSNGTISKTTNGGVNWVVQYDSANVPVFSFSFPNEMTGFACGMNGRIYSTTNSGENWSSRILIDAGGVNTCIYFKDAMTGFVAGRGGPRIYRTTNGGLNWTSLLIGSFSVVTYFEFFNSTEGIFFSSSYHFGYSTTDPSVYYKTSDGGASWVGPFPSPRTTCRNAFFENLSTGWISCTDTVYRTTNGGTNWTGKYVPGTNISLSFINSQMGYVCSDSGRISKTTDGGLNWTLQNSNCVEDLNCISTPSINKCYSVGNRQTVVSTLNAGSNWVCVPYSYTNNALNYVKAFAPSTVYAIGSVKFLKSFDSGTAWTVSNNPILNYSYSMFFVDSQTGWIGGNSRIFNKTTNGGLTWENCTLPPGAGGGVGSGIFFINSQTGWHSNGRYIFKTINGGSNWTEFEYPEFYYFNKLFFVNDLTGWASGEDGLIIKTTNGGSNWVSQGHFGGVPISIFFLNSQTGWYSTSNVVRKTTNSGTSWDSIATVTNLSGITFLSPLTGWGASIGGIYKTTNGGFNWNRQNTEIGGINCFSFLDENTGWAVGSNGVILKTTTSGNVFISQISTEIPEKFSLYQNYPNPFNPSTNIKFDIHKQGIATLKVFDLLGKEMETLVDEQLSVGTYEITFNASSLPSGIYFYVLKTGDFVESNKMILVK